VNTELLKKAVELAEKLGYVFVATADAAGFPHVAAAAKLSFALDGKIAVSAWFCPSTMANINENPRLSIVVWDSEKDKGYQLIGESEKVLDVAIMDGFSAALEDRPPIPQIESRLTVRVDKILHFTHAPHSDSEM
jgi:uncharacterized protein